MKNVFLLSVLILMRELSWRFFGHKIDRRKLLLLAAVFTVTGFLFQFFVHGYANVSSFTKSTVQSNEFLEGEVIQQVRLTLPPTSFNESVQSVSVEHDSVVDIQSQRKKNRNLTNTTVTAPLSPSGRVPLGKQTDIRLLPPTEALVYAKEEIDHAPFVNEDPNLYAPLFKNISVFKRSYELMETILKVYIYRDGARPVFHNPHLKGIYASEGWFMKLMEGNNQFVTKDPERAHLFYLPYSVHQMALALYVPESHNMKPLSIFLRDYVNKIAAKYPFWNRTHGSDHFLVACHDWGPYTVAEHKELAGNTIKALCNADASEGIFIAGRDVSLPETTIRAPRRPHRYLGGNRVSLRPILAFFAGGMHGRVRPTLLKYWGGEQDEDMKIYKHLPLRISKKMTYIQHMKSSKYCLCPMGFEVNSPRIVEAIYYECVPVIIADNFVLPLSEFLDWSAFSVVVAEKDIPRLKEILMSIPTRKYVAMQNNVKMVQKHFLWNPKPMRYDLFHMILHSIWFNKLNQI
ncbi:probable glycosyltransferase At5g25310 [Lathyrus oleraceus]|nr:probable glycosyltransferase At5g25310 [Pisum sativum]